MITQIFPLQQELNDHVWRDHVLIGGVIHPTQSMNCFMHLDRVKHEENKTCCMLKCKNKVNLFIIIIYSVLYHR